MKTSTTGPWLAAGYIGSIIAAAAAVTYIGTLPILPGIRGPAGVYVVGVTMVLRDLLQDAYGPKRTYLFMIIGAVLSALVSPTIALAATAAFLVSETLDMAVYTPLRRHTLIGAVLASNAVGILADTTIFLTIAFGSLDFFPGQVIGKIFSTLAAVVVLTLIHHRKAPTP